MQNHAKTFMYKKKNVLDITKRKRCSTIKRCTEHRHVRKNTRHHLYAHVRTQAAKIEDEPLFFVPLRLAAAKDLIASRKRCTDVMPCKILFMPACLYVVLYDADVRRPVCRCR